jgi:Protein of unknown function (DUF3800)
MISVKYNPPKHFLDKKRYMLKIYVDDSTSNTGDESLFLAGYINTAEMWEHFTIAWNFALRQRPSIQYLKMSEAESLRGQFSGWTREDRDTKILKLAHIINISKPHFVFCRVGRLDYNAVISPIAPHNLKNPYFIAFWGIIDSVARYCQNDSYFLPVDFIFDEQGSMGTDAILFYKQTKNDLKPRLRAVLGDTPIFQDEKNVLPLQAADMLAWHVRRNHERSGDEGRPTFGLLTERGVERQIERRHLASIAKQMKRVPGIELIQSKNQWKKARESISEINESGYMPKSNRLWMRYQLFKYYFAVWRSRRDRN